MRRIADLYPDEAKTDARDAAVTADAAQRGPLRHRPSIRLYVDQADGQRIGALWLLAARSPRSLVICRCAPPRLPRGER
jgi:hypothetical protein